MMLAAGCSSLHTPMTPARLSAPILGLREAVAPLALSVVFAAASPAVAASSDNLRDALRFEGVYADRLHPLCERRITVDREPVLVTSSDTTYYTAHFSGTDVGPPGIGALVKIACDEDNIKQHQLREWSFDARISADGDRVDAGDNVHVGRWHASVVSEEGAADEWTGIRWKDSNRWFLVDEAEAVATTTAATAAAATTTTAATTTLASHSAEP